MITLKKIIATLCIAASVLAANSFAEAGGARIAAVAINVADLEKATAFYSEVFGMQVKRNITNEKMSENIMAFPSGAGSSLVLVQYKEQTLVESKPARIVFYAQDPVGMIAKGVSLGAEVIREPTEAPSMKAVIGIMRDLDGYPVEIIKR